MDVRVISFFGDDNVALLLETQASDNFLDEK